MTLPAGFAVRLGPLVRVREGGRTLIGGSPTRLVRLRDAAVSLLSDGVLRADDATPAALADRLLAAGLAEPVIDLLEPVDPAQLTVVVPVRDRPGPLERLLTTLGGTLAVLVVDDASLDPGPVEAVAARHGARLLRLPAHRGPAAARNAGRRAATTPLVAFVDSDVVTDAEALLRLARHFADPAVAAVAPRIGALDPPAGWIGRYEARRSALDLGPHGALVRPLTSVGWVPSACLLVRTAAAGDFDESMHVGEDVDLVWRLDAAGHRVRYDPSVVARHEHRTDLLSWARRKAFYGSSAAALAARHDTAVRPAVLTPLAATLSGAVLAQRRWSVPVAAVATGLMARRLYGQAARCDHPAARTAELTARSLALTAQQVAGLLLRHGWPAAAAACLVSRRARRAVLVAAVAETVVDHRRRARDVPLAGYAAAHRLDDLSYGLGLWAGAWRARSARAVLPWIRR